MADQGLDTSFGLQSTCTAHVSGFGGRPLGIVVGSDGRPTLVCAAPAQPVPAASIATKPGQRFVNPPVDTPRVATFPPDGRPAQRGARAVEAFGAAAGDRFLAARAAVAAGRVAVLGEVLRSGQLVLTLSTLRAAPPVGGVSDWVPEPSQEIAGLPAGTARRAGVAFTRSGIVVVAASPVAAQFRSLRMLVWAESEELVFVDLGVARDQLGLAEHMTVEARVTSVCEDDARGLLLGITWVAVDKTGPGFRPFDAVDEARASVVRIHRGARRWEPDLAFGPGGIWTAGAADGEITTADHMSLSDEGVVIAGRARQAGTDTLFAACLDGAGQPLWVTHPTPNLPGGPTGLAIDGGGRILICGSSRPMDPNYRPDDPAEAVVACLLQDGQPDPGFGTNGVARVRLNGATYATAIAVTPAGELIVATALRWGWQTSAGMLLHPCVTRLTSSGSLDRSFGLAGLCRHDGVGNTAIAAVDPAGRVWSAGIAAAFLGLDSQPPHTARWLWYLTLTRLTTDGELDGTFGLEGMVEHQLAFRDYEVHSLVALAGGGAIVAGSYTPPPNQTVGGTWVARLTAAGSLDAGFGTGGVVTIPARDVFPLAELADGSLQGKEWVSGNWLAVRLTSSGADDSGYGVGGRVTINHAIAGFPPECEPSGEWLAPIYSASRIGAVGLIRCQPNGTIDTAFGAAATAPASDPHMDAASLLPRGGSRTWLNPQWAPEGGPHRTLRLADGSYLTLWTLAWQEDVTTFGSTMTTAWTSAGLVLMSWSSAGLPLAKWGNYSARVIVNPLASRNPWDNWLGWKYRCALPQADGSIIVGLEGEDPGALPAGRRPGFPQTSAYFCRLLPGTFDLDQNFGVRVGAGLQDECVVARLPCQDWVTPSGTTLVEYQTPLALGVAGGGAVTGAIGCQTAAVPFNGLFRSPPNLLADGSVAMARLI